MMTFLFAFADTDSDLISDMFEAIHLGYKNCADSNITIRGLVRLGSDFKLILVLYLSSLSYRTMNKTEIANI